MADYLQDFNFEFEDDSTQEELYSCSIDSNDSIPELDEIKTPLLYDSKINQYFQSSSSSNGSTRSNSIYSHNSPINVQVFDESLIELMDLNHDDITAPLNQYNQFDYNFKSPNSMIPRTITQELIDNDINNIIKQGSMNLKNNYKLWLNTKSS